MGPPFQESKAGGYAPLHESHLADDVWRGLVRTLGRRQFRFAFASGSDIVDWAYAALVAGWDSGSLRILAGLDKPPNDFEVDSYLWRAVEEAGVKLPGEEELAELYALTVARDIVAGSVGPYEVSRELRSLWLATGCPSRLSAWSAFEDQYELARDGVVFGDVADVEREIRAEARRMLSSDE